MDADLTLGVVAHRGGLLVQRPELTVGVIQAVSRTSGLTVEVIARQPLDRRDATQRQRDIRLRRDEPVRVAPRRLLPDHDEGENLRLGWLDQAGHARWEYGSTVWSWSGDDHTGSDGPSWRCICVLPPMFDQLSLVLAWPEIGFEETTITIPLPDQATVEQGTTSIWQAPVDALPVTTPLTDHHTNDHLPVRIEAGTVIAEPRVLHRSDHAVVALTRLTAIGSALSIELFGAATGSLADTLTAEAFPPAHQWEGPSLAVVRGNDALWLGAQEATSSGGDHSFVAVQEFATHRPEGDTLDLIVAWPQAGLPNVLVRIPR
ncbi:hypothetical protein JOF56_006967 [Kibdelosporangium banguiense]|uniref:Uncharacterized protein n=1 Tax=Kibdelosporangium banguiense TaxID=1365924 RepID=A0ABS4TQA1_9PSEU|nr:hypothetical protein [Kibdelosporangium banguiense]MBP2326582.1 hypothetical protein [Kibdelosporangium banguiense]